MLEHYWLNNWPVGHDPFVPYTDTPWFYNMDDRSQPATLFYDGSVRLLPNLEVLISNDRVVRAGEDPLWANDPGCFGSGGYFETHTNPPSNILVKTLIDTETRYHMFTRDGILGRDTTITP